MWSKLDCNQIQNRDSTGLTWHIDSFGLYTTARCNHRLTAYRWQSRSAVTNLADQVQRIQIRRIERDVFETDELVKRCLDRLKGSGGRGGRRGSGSGSPGDGGSSSGVRRRSVRSRPGSVRMPSRRGSAASAQFRDVEEREFVRRRPDGESSNTGRRRERSPRQRYEYEVVQPGRIFVDVDEGEPQRRPRIVPAKSYNRERQRDRYSGTERE